ncbi:hypothetical protein LXA47_01990 [Massilia sp. P8910]|uniref:hypothetical protein n=1 Tax=Massilia antarctica TaxID=2765360 RepID=UPI001E638F24|nr:hypothetical protein [Massilia antarctica]MCE3602384.1 hypothetical protein [Massilia antarctica]
MYDDDSLAAALEGSDYYSSVGPNNNGTYGVPTSAQTSNQPWDSAGGVLGGYGKEIFGILSQGVGAWSQYKKNEQFLDYQRYEATQGGVFQQGRPNPMPVYPVQNVQTAFGMSPMVLILLVGGAVLLLRK